MKNSIANVAVPRATYWPHVSQVDNATTCGDGHGTRTLVAVQLCEDIPHVDVYGAGADAKRRGDFLVPHTGGEELQHVHFASCQRRQGRASRELGRASVSIERLQGAWTGC